MIGDFHKLDKAGYGKVLNAPLLADDLWQNPLTTPAEPTETINPQAPFRWSGGTLLAPLALMTATMLLRRKQARPTTCHRLQVLALVPSAIESWFNIQGWSRRFQIYR